MSHLSEIKRPSTALTKLVEAIGIILGTPKTSSRESEFRVPLPSNYASTIAYISNDFSATLTYLSKLKSADISDDIAAELYLKMNEPGFDYEAALREGGLASRELFDAVVLLLLQLQSDAYRIPVSDINVLVVVSGNRSSYAALDTAAHIFSHGKLTVVPLTVEDNNRSIQDYLCRDMERRCNLHFKLPNFRYSVEPITVQSADQIVWRIEDALVASKCGTLCLGMDDCNLGLDSQSHVLMWAAWTSNIDVVFSKGYSKVRPFTETHNRRTALVYIDDPSNAADFFTRATKFMRPGDYVIFVTVVLPETKGDNRETRFDFGARYGWISDPRSSEQVQTIVPGIDTRLADMNDDLTKLLGLSQMMGRVRVEQLSPMTTISQVLRQAVIEEAADILVLRRKKDMEIVIECAQDSMCTIAIVK